MPFRPDPTTHAGQVLTMLQAHTGWRAVTVEGGYGIDDQGNRFTLDVPPPRTARMVRNANGRCTAATFRYQDGSVLQFTWSETHGARYQQGRPMAPGDTGTEPTRRRARPR